jgi:membrane associated rhomboid family serine protease
MLRSTDRRRTRVVPAHPVGAAVQMFVLVGVLYVVEAVDQSMNGALEFYGVRPRQLTGLEGVLFAPLLHAGWAHLIANTVPLLVLGWLVLAGGTRQFVTVTVIVWLISGVGTWVIGSPGVHLGASGIAFGWLVFLLLRGLFLWSVKQIFVALLLFFYWGGMLWGVIPGQPGISWEAHLFGAVGGLIAAWLLARDYRRGSGTRRSATLPG